MMPRQYIKTIRLISAIVPLLMIVGLLGIYHFYKAAEKRNLSHQTHIKRTPYTKFNISGFDFQSSIASRQVIAIKADRFTIKKKKIGFLSFGLIKEAVFENARIKLFGRRSLSNGCKEGQSTDVVHHKRTARSGTFEGEFALKPSASTTDLVFKDVFSRKAFPDLPVKKISSVIMKPLFLELYDHRDVVTTIAASEAMFRIKQRDILLKGRVTVTSGAKQLNAEELRFYLKEGFGPNVEIGFKNFFEIASNDILYITRPSNV